MPGSDEAERDDRSVQRRLHQLPRREAGRAVGISVARALGGVAALVTLYYVVPADTSSAGQVAVHVTLAMVVIAGVVWWQLRAVLSATLPALRALEALAVAVTLMVCMFATAYVSLSSRDPGAFSEPLAKTGALYFTVTTLATVGYGDIAARTDAARIAVMIQMVFNVVVIGLAVRSTTTAARHRIGHRQAG